MGAYERLDEVSISLGSRLLRTENDQLGFDAAPPKPNPHFEHDGSTVLCLRSGGRLLVEKALGQALAVDFDCHLTLCNSDTPNERGNDFHLARE